MVWRYEGISGNLPNTATQRFCFFAAGMPPPIWRTLGTADVGFLSTPEFCRGVFLRTTASQLSAVKHYIAGCINHEINTWPPPACAGNNQRSRDSASCSRRETIGVKGGHQVFEDVVQPDGAHLHQPRGARAYLCSKLLSRKQNIELLNPHNTVWIPLRLSASAASTSQGLLIRVHSGSAYIAFPMLCDQALWGRVNGISYRRVEVVDIAIVAGRNQGCGCGDDFKNGVRLSTYGPVFSPV
ncbi:hypothetical protein C8R43DRAFT_943760 [Mycena crocata]|nr:hypothetical protein C8R43DRAFT_943760 [Mycena crocata]